MALLAASSMLTSGLRRPSRSGVHIDLDAGAFSFRLCVFEDFHPAGRKELNIVGVIALYTIDGSDFYGAHAGTRVFFQIVSQVLFIDSASQPPPSGAGTGFCRSIRHCCACMLPPAASIQRSISCFLFIILGVYDSIQCFLRRRSQRADVRPAVQSGSGHRRSYVLCVTDIKSFGGNRTEHPGFGIYFLLFGWSALAIFFAVSTFII